MLATAVQQADPQLAKYANDLDAILTLSRDLHGLRDLDRILELILAAAQKLISADRCSCFIRDIGTGELFTRVAQDSKTIRLERGVGIAGSVAESGALVNIPDAYEDDRFNPENDLRSGYKTRSILCMPLISHDDKIVGVLQALNKESGEPFDSYDEKILFALCSHAAVSIDTAQLIAKDLELQRLQADMDIAHRIQQSLLPEDEPELAGWRFAAWQRPCEETGGDYHDFIETDNHVDLVIADVSGHGIGAAMYMSTARAFLRALHPSHQSAELFALMNDLLEEDMADDSFMTAAIVRLNTDGCAQAVLAGHDPPLVYRSERDQFDDIDGGGLLMGAIPASEYEPIPISPLQPGDILVLFTDGLFEAVNPTGEEWGFDRFKKVIRSHATKGVEVVVAQVISAVSAWIEDGPVMDDWTIVAAERTA